MVSPRGSRIHVEHFISLFTRRSEFVVIGEQWCCAKQLVYIASHCGYNGENIVEDKVPSTQPKSEEVNNKFGNHFVIIQRLFSTKLNWCFTIVQVYRFQSAGL